MIRTRYAPSPTGYMHIGNLRSALYEYLIAKSSNGKFIFRLEDTDKERYVEGATEIIYNTLKIAGIKHDEGPDIGGDYGPYVQTQRQHIYKKYAEILVKSGHAYYCFCSKERLDDLHKNDQHAKYDRYCCSLSRETIDEKIESDSYVIRHLIPEGQTTFHDEIWGSITVDNKELEDQVLLKSDGLPTYNFANVVDDHLMEITHVVRGSEYLSSTPKYNLLYEAFGWDIPKYIHLPLILNKNGQKLSKRRGDASFEDLLKMGFLPEAIVNYIALLGWSPDDNNEFFTLDELIKVFTPSNISKSPSILDMTKLTWMNSEYIKKMDEDKFYELSLPFLEQSVKRKDIDLKRIAKLLQSRVDFAADCVNLVDFIDDLPEYDISLYIHKKMKTTFENSLASLEKSLPVLKCIDDWKEKNIHDTLIQLIENMGIKNGVMLWPLRTAISGKATSPCGAAELAVILGKEQTIYRIEKGIELLKNHNIT